MFSSRLAALVLASLGTITTIAVVGCAAPTADTSNADQGASSESDLTGSRSVALKYEGTCAFLKDCSSYSKSLPADEVRWGCTGVGICSDSALWVAGPNRSYCGKSVKICKGSTCTTALVKDVSVSRDWEASNGVLDALSLSHGLTGKCSGYGGGSVTVTVGGSTPAAATVPDQATSSSSSSSGSTSSSSSGASTTTTSGSSGSGAPDPNTGADDSGDPADDGTTSSSSSSGSDPAAPTDPEVDPAPDPTQGDNGCFSATLQLDVPELTCVHSTSTGLDYQCKTGGWYQGVSGLMGPYGECLNDEIR